MDRRFIDWIWHVRGSVTLAPEQSSAEAFDQLDSLFRQTGTSHERTRDTLTFRKKDPAAQDKMSVFDDGVLKIEERVAGAVLRYDLTSRALLFCFLAPVLFLSIGQLTIVMAERQKPSAETASTSGKKPNASQHKAATKATAPMNPLDRALGAPAPEKPEKKAADESEEKNEKPSPTAAYVFAAIFATLYVVGRILEDRLVKALFKKRLPCS